jgi:hypothetical protein
VQHRRVLPGDALVRVDQVGHLHQHRVLNEFCARRCATGGHGDLQSDCAQSRRPSDP